MGHDQRANRRPVRLSEFECHLAAKTMAAHKPALEAAMATLDANSPAVKGALDLAMAQREQTKAIVKGVDDLLPKTGGLFEVAAEVSTPWQRTSPDSNATPDLRDVQIKGLRRELAKERELRAAAMDRANRAEKRLARYRRKRRRPERPSMSLSRAPGNGASCL